MLPGETVATGAVLEECEFCGEEPTEGVMSSPAGYYVGYSCCMPFSRETRYFGSYEEAEKALEDGTGKR
jgi:hypothetical protein